MFRLLPPLALALVLAGCASDPEPEPPRAPVRLVVEAPADPATVDDDVIEIRGRVWPAGTPVLVAGDEAGTEGGAFFATVALEPGVNVVDVMAGAPRRAAAMTAIRVIRRVPVQVPDLSGLETEDAVRELEELGLAAEVDDRGGLIDELLPGEPRVCETDPDAGDMVRPGSNVTVVVSETC